MSVRRIDSQRSFYHTSFVCGELFGTANRYRLFREKILPKLSSLRSRLESLYCESNGRPAIDPVLLCGVTLLQFMEKVTDRRAAEQVVYHLGWKYALDMELPYEGFHPTVLVYFRDRLEEQKAERVIFDGVVELLIELGLVKRAGKQRIDSTHILGYVKEMSRLECAVETVRLALEELSGVVVVGKRPEFWERLWALYVQSEVGWRLSKAERDSRYRQCGQDIKELLEWIDKGDSKLGEIESVKLLRRVFEEQFEVVDGAVQSRRTRPSRAVQNPHDPDAHYADKGTKQWIGYKVHVVESVDPKEPAKIKAEPGEHFITEVVTTEAAQDEMAGLAEGLKRQQEHHEIRPEAMYADGGYVTESTLWQAESATMELLGPTRPDPHKGPYNADGFIVDVENRRAVCPQGKPALNVVASRIATWEPSTIVWSGPANATHVLCKNNVRVPRVGGECWSLVYATIWCRNAGISVARIALRQTVVEAYRVAVLHLLAVDANRLQQHDGLGCVAGYAVPVMRRLRVDRPAAREPHVEPLAPQ